MILVSAFEPFGGAPVNASEAVLNALVAAARPAGEGALELPRAPADAADAPPLRFRPLLLPCVYGVAAERLAAAVTDGCRAMLLLGEAGGRAAISVERRGLNHVGAELADNAGTVIRAAAVEPSGPAERPVGVDAVALAARIAAAGIAAEVSDSAGAFVCNDTLYRALAAFGDRLPVAFLHLPVTPEEALRRGAGTGLATAACLEAVVIALRFMAAAASGG